MKKNTAFFEGKFIALCYTEVDYEGEDTAALIYQVKEGKLNPLYGVLHLPHGTYWNRKLEQYNEALRILQEQDVREVYVPWIALDDENFFGVTLGFHALSEGFNEKGEIECWCEFGAFTHDWTFESLLNEHGIKIHDLDVKTLEIIDSR